MIRKVIILRLLLFAVILYAVSWCQAELFTAISEMEPLLKTHKRIIDYMDFYIEKEEQRLQNFKRHLYLYKQEHDKTMEELPYYLNPRGAYTLIKRLTTDLQLIEDSIKISTDCIENITMNHDDMTYPTMEDLTGAAQALTRLQETYHLDVRELSEGILNGVVHSTAMTTGDCYVLGQILCDNNDVNNALSWMMEAYRKFEKEYHKYMLPFTEGDIVEYIGFSHYLLGDIKLALQWTYKLLKLDPSNSRAIGNVPHFKKLISEEEANARKRRRGDIEVSEQDFKVKVTKERNINTEREGRWRFSYKRETNNYLALCRGEIDVAADVSKRLKCWYSSENHPFLKYAPFKVEQMYITPDIFIFHDVLSDDEIELIKAMSKPRFQRAAVHDQKTGEGQSSPYRISKSSWLRNEEFPVIARISQRVTDMTGLDMETAEDLQVVNYGIGGHYEPHFDFVRKRDKPFSRNFGNRIATVLFYMSEVAQGGATVFTELGLSLFPIKGAAAFWMNLHPSGEGDMATRHGACPVLSGSKWVCNKWIHQSGQELIRPCTLEYQKEGVHNKPPPPAFKL